MQRHRRLVGYAPHHWPISVLILGLIAPVLVVLALRLCPTKLFVGYVSVHAVVPALPHNFRESISLSPRRTLLLVEIAIGRRILLVVKSISNGGLSCPCTISNQRLATVFYKLEQPRTGGA
jgi:uncharacterized membrane protein (DUF4010 family)